MLPDLLDVAVDLWVWESQAVEGLPNHFGPCLKLRMHYGIGPGRARQFFLYGTQVGAAEAERIGLVDAVVPKGGALEAAMERARFLAAQAPLPIALTKKILADGLERALEEEREFQTLCFLTPDHAEGKAAFLEKREPRFRPD